MRNGAGPAGPSKPSGYGVRPSLHARLRQDGSDTAAGVAAWRFGTRAALQGSLMLAGVGLPLLLVPSLPAVLAGLVLIAVGTFLAQATAIGFVSRTMAVDRGMASGRWACVASVALALGAAALLARRLCSLAG